MVLTTVAAASTRPHRDGLDDVDEVVAGARQSVGHIGARSNKSASALAFFFSHRYAI